MRYKKYQRYIKCSTRFRRIAAAEGNKLPAVYLGRLFEQFVGLELIRLTKAYNLVHKVKIYFWRDLNGQEIDWLIAKEDLLIPVEVKWTAKPNISDAKYLKLFKQEYNNVENCYIVCQTLRKIKLADNIYAISWQDIAELIL